MEIIFLVAQKISLGIGIVGTLIIVWGAILTTIAFIKVEFSRLTSHVTHKKKRSVRHKFGAFILLGLEFFIAGDIIRTVMRPSLQQVAILGSLVVIRVIISYFLTKEVKEALVEEEQDLGKKGR